MGASQSSPAENIWKAANANRPQELARLIGGIQARSEGGTWSTRDFLEWKDKLGRTPLIVCARENRTACAQVLLQAGADVNYVNCTPEGRGSALHEAAHRGADEMVALLLSFGASPWVSNKNGRTALDEAVLSGACGPTLRLKQLALHRSSAMVKTVRLAGLSNPYKTRHLLVIPFLPCPQSGNATPPVPRKQLWFYTDEKGITPKVRVWLCGATVHLGPRETVLRLHPTHGHPGGDLHTRFENGYCISLRPNNTLPTTLATFNDLLAACCPSMLQGGPNVSAAVGSPLSASRPTTPSSASPSRPPPPPEPPASLPPRPPGSPGSGYLFSEAHARELSQGGSTDNATGPDLMHALPGESDTEFAARLAAILSEDAPIAPTPSQQPSLAGRGSLATTSQQSGSGTTTPFPPLPFLPQSSDPCTPGPPPRARGTWHSGPHQPHAFEPHEYSGLQGAASAPAAGPHPQQALYPPSPLNPVSDAGHSSIFNGVPGDRSSPPSAPPLYSAPSQPDSTPSAPSQEESQCVICLSAPRECGFLHETTVHLCVCRDCKKSMAIGSPCPLCRKRIERVIDVF